MQSLNLEVLLNQKRSFGGVLKENCSETFRKKDREKPTLEFYSSRPAVDSEEHLQTSL